MGSINKKIEVENLVTLPLLPILNLNVRIVFEVQYIIVFLFDHTAFLAG